MRLVAVSCARDELDIIEPFVRHTLAYVDQLVILDNGSTDGTRQILQCLVEESLPLEVVDDPSLGNYQWQRMTHLMRALAIEKYAADWVLPLDADEFLTARDLRTQLHQELDNDETLGVTWQSYVPDPQDNASEINPVLRIRHRMRCEGSPCIKVFVPARLARNPDVSITQGNHTLTRGGQTLRTKIAGDAFLAHFPGRSPQQFARKVAIKHLQYLAMSERDPIWGTHYQGPVDLLRQDVAKLDAAFQQTMMCYNIPNGTSFEPELQDAPLAYRGGLLKYTKANSSIPLTQTLLECAEMFARQHASLASEQRELQSTLHQLLMKLQDRQGQLEEREAQLQLREVALAAMRRSWSWRVGRAVVSPARWLRKCVDQMRGMPSTNDIASSDESQKAA